MIWQTILAEASGNLRRRPLRNGLATLGVALGTATLVALLGLSRGVQAHLARSMAGQGALALVQVLPPPADAGQPVLGDAELRSVAALPGVRAALPVVFVPATLRFGERAPAGTLLGLSPGPSPPYALRAGRAPEPTDTHAALLTPAGQRALGIADAAMLLTSALEVTLRRGGNAGEQRTLQLRVAGVVADEVPGMLAIVPLPLAEDAAAWIATGASASARDLRLAEQASAALLVGGVGLAEASGERYSGVWALAESPGRVRDVVAGAERLGLSTLSSGAIADTVESVFRAVNAGLGAIAGVALAVAALGIANALLTSMSERVPEIGVLKALGATDDVVERLFLAEAGLLGALGGALGVALGWLAALAAAGLANRVAGPRTLGFALAPRLDPDLLLLALLGAVALSLVAGWLPARRAARLLPAQALRAE